MAIQRLGHMYDNFKPKIDIHKKGLKTVPPVKYKLQSSVGPVSYRKQQKTLWDFPSIWGTSYYLNITSIYWNNYNLPFSMPLWKIEPTLN